MTESELFDEAFLRRAPGLAIRGETAADGGFLAKLFAVCSPLASVLPPALLEVQSSSQQASYRQSHPTAMRRIVLHNGVPVGRIVVDWNVAGVSHGVDIAVLPQTRATLAGPHMLRAWLEVADRLGRPCSLDVLADNRARLFYRRLGFALEERHDPDTPIEFMTRATQLSHG